MLSHNVCNAVNDVDSVCDFLVWAVLCVHESDYHVSVITCTAEAAEFQDVSSTGERGLQAIHAAGQHGPASEDPAGG